MGMLVCEPFTSRWRSEAEHVLDWFHIAMKFTNLQQLAKGVDALTDGGVRSHALAELERAKWRFWNAAGNGA
jgi:hypothetical protein